MATRSSYQWTLDNYGKPCVQTPLVSVEWYPGQVDRMLPVHAEIYRALGAIFLAYKYVVRDADTGFYNCRPITGGTRPSPHSWPIAGDINWKTNPYIQTPTLRKIKWGVETDMPAAMVTEAKTITAGGIVALRWGGDWLSIKDPMHWEVRVTPAEIAKGVHAPRGFYNGSIGDDEVTLKRGDKGAAVHKHQTALLAWKPDCLPQWGADSDFGAETEAAVKLYQNAADMTQTGQIDGVTSALLLTYLEGGIGKHTHAATATLTEATTVTLTEGTKVAVKIGDAR